MRIDRTVRGWKLWWTLGSSGRRKETKRLERKPAYLAKRGHSLAKNRKMEKAVCPTCGKEFMPLDVRQIYCSKSCCNSVTKSNGAIKEKIKIKNKEEDIKNTYCSELDCASSEQEQELPAKRASPTHEKSKSEIAKPPDGSPLFISLPLLGNGHYDVTESMIGQLQELYPAVDVQQQLRNMRGWIEGNPKKMKKNGAKFVHGWLMRRQERGGDLKSTPQSHAMSWQEREQDAFERAIAEAKLRDAARARGEAV